jgi:large repetitive protein
MKTRWALRKKENSRSPAAKSRIAWGLSLFVFVLPVCIPPTASCQVSPAPPIGGPALDSSRFHFRVSGAPGSTYVVETSGDLLSWAPVVTNSIPATGYFDVGDSQAGQSPKRFYRTVYLPGAAATDNLVGSFRQDTILVKPKSGIALGALDGLHQSLGVQVIQRSSGTGLLVLQAPSTTSLSNLIANYQRSDLVEYVEPDLQMPALQEPDDFRFSDGSLWNLHNAGQGGGRPDADIDAPEGWDVRNTADNIIVAVIDTGVRYTHEDLAGNMWVNPGEIAGNNVDDDGDGYVDDVHGIDAINNSGDPNDVHGHGTHVSGIIGAVGDNSVGVVGVCWRVQIMACRFLDPAGQGFISDAIKCIDYARSKGAKVINASWGSTTFTSAALRDAINGARQAGIIFVAAAGNSADDNDVHPLYPASYDLDNIISVAAMTRTDDLAFFSHYGSTSVDLGAPGAAIFSCWNGSDSDYRYFDGTSMAAPHVTGACALLLARYPSENYQQIINRILSNVDRLPGLAGKCMSGGRLNLHKALGGSSPPPPDEPVISLEAFDPAASETGPDKGVILFRRTGDTSQPIQVSWTFSGTAVNGSDFEQLPTTSPFPAGLAEADLTISILDDSLIEGNETVIVTLVDGPGYRVGSPSSATVTIADNDQGPPPSRPTVRVEATDGDASEAGNTGTFTVSRTGDTSAALTVRSSLNGTAQNGTEYQQLSSSTTIPAGSSSVTVTVTPIDDATVEGSETVVLTLSSDAAYDIGSPSSATVTIADNDQPPPPPKPTVTVTASDANAAEPNNSGTFTIARTGSTASALTVNYTVNGSASSSSDYQSLGTSVTIPAGSSSATRTVTPIDDSAVEGSETVVLTLSSDAAYAIGSPNSATVTTSDNDQPPPPPNPTVTVTASDANAAEPSNSGTFTITRTGSTASALAVNYTVNGGASSGSDYQSLGTSVTIPAGNSSATRTVTPVDDTSVEGAETVVLTLSANAAYTVGSPSSATVTIADNDQPPPPTGQTVTVSANDPSAAETGPNYGQFRIARSGDNSSPLTVRYTLNGTANNGSDYESLSGSVTIAAGSIGAFVMVRTIDDDELVEGSETVVLSISSDGAYDIGSPSSATVTIADNDTVTISADDASAGEAGPNYGQFRIARNDAGSALTVRYSVTGSASNGTDYEGLSGSVTIAAGSIGAFVMVRTIDDDEVEGSETVVLSIIGSPSSATVTIVDDD